MKHHPRFLLLAAAVLALALLWWGARTGRVSAPRQRSQRTTTAAAPRPAVAPKNDRLPEAPVDDVDEEPDEDCLPGALEQCHMGDLWSLDSCGKPEEKLEECEARSCRDGGCEPAPTEPCEEPPEGRCVGDTVRLCELGKLRVIDCGRRGLRCGQGEEGAECKPEVPRTARCQGPTRCDGDVLTRCEDGQVTRIDCGALRARCVQLPGGAAPSCVEVRSPEPLMAQGCGPCGCPPATVGEETCDGRDEDGDGLLDDEIACGAVPVIAFVVTDASGYRSHADADVEEELARASAAFARSDVEGAPSFVLDSVVPIAVPSLLELDQRELDQLADDPLVHPVRDRFYVPMVFTDRVITGETPKSGVATLPNGTCGGIQEGQGPDVGLVAVAKARYPTTVTHELGHFLGLCHTHDRQESTAVLATLDPSTGSIARCGPICRGEGDGICDTPSDPGPELCDHDDSCRTACRIHAAPDPHNLMSYYAACRDRFTAEQLRLVQHTLALRRGWHRCAGGVCACELGDASCPVGMTCRPIVLQTGAQATRCALDGPRAPGADCRANEDCSRGAVCLSDRTRGVRRCVRPCREPLPDCTCTEAGEALSVCIEDLRRAR